MAHNGEVFDRLTGTLVRNRNGEQVGRRVNKTLPPKVAEAAIDIRLAANAASDWLDFHQRLAEIGVSYRTKGSGAVIAVGEHEVKASQIHSHCSLRQLQRRLGTFENNPSPIVQGYEAYQCAYRQKLDDIRAAHARERERLKSWLDLIVSEYSSNPVAVAAIRAEYASALSALDAAFGTAKAELASEQLSLHQWQSGERRPDLAGIPLPTLLLPAANSIDKSVAAASGFNIRGARFAEYHDASGVKIVSDLCSAIIVHDTRQESIDLALRLAASRWGTVRINASRENTLLIAERAEALGIHTVDTAGRQLTAHMRGTLPEATVAAPKDAAMHPDIAAPVTVSDIALPSVGAQDAEEAPQADTFELADPPLDDLRRGGTISTGSENTEAKPSSMAVCPPPTELEGEVISSPDSHEPSDEENFALFLHHLRQSDRGR